MNIQFEFLVIKISIFPNCQESLAHFQMSIVTYIWEGGIQEYRGNELTLMTCVEQKEENNCWK
jgi:hypothetical protein